MIHKLTEDTEILSNDFSCKI